MTETNQKSFFILPEHMDGFEIADAEPGVWVYFKNELPPIDEMIWIIDKAGAVSFGCRRESGIYALCFRDAIPVAWKKRTIGAPGIKFD